MYSAMYNIITILVVAFASISSTVFGSSIRAGARTPREAGSIPSVYQQIAHLTGGSVLNTDKSNISVVAGVLGAQPDVLMSKFSMKPTESNTRIIPVDNTISNMRIRIVETTHMHQPVFGVNSPRGVPVMVASKTLGNGALEITLSNPMPGDWQLIKLDSYSWDISVYGETLLDFYPKFYVTDSNTGYNVQLEGRPIQGKNTPVIVQMSGMDKTASVDSMLLVDSMGAKLSIAPLLRQGRRGQTLRTLTKIPSRPFRVVIKGRDKIGNTFTRSAKSLVNPSSLGIVIEELKGDLHVGGQMYIVVKASNYGKAYREVTLSISDDKGLVAPPTNHRVYLFPGLSATVHFTINGGSTVGVSSNVVIKAVVPGDADADDFQYILRTFTVHASQK